MGNLINIEESNYMSNIVDRYAQNKIGQYSKYLNLTPTFVTYYPVNQIMSKTDTGTGSVVSELGYSSPLRFNKIIGLPVYNLPILSPDMEYDDTGMDLQLDLNDITLLPNTIKPTVPDYMVVTISNDLKILFRVNSFRYNTIMSNDFITINLDIKKIGPDVDADIEPLVVKTYYTIFDNIGTEDKCFIEEEDVATVNSISDAANELIGIYNDLYLDEVAGGYVLPDLANRRHVIYDVFLNHFINETNLIPHLATTLTTLPYLDFVPPGYESLYRQSLLYAIYKQSTSIMSDSMYYWLSPISNPHSPFIMFHYNALSLRYRIIREGTNSWDIRDYYDHLLLHAVKNHISNYPLTPIEENGGTIDDSNSENDVKPYKPPTEPPQEPDLGEINPDLEECDDEIEDDSITSNPDIEPSEPDVSEFNPYLPPKDSFEEEVITWKKPEIELSKEEIALVESYTDNQKYIFNLIIQFMNNKPSQIDRTKLIPPTLTHGRFSYFYTPIVVFLLQQEQHRYFSNPTVSDAMEEIKSQTPK